MNQQVKRLAGRASAAFGALGLGAAMTVVSLLAPSVPVANAFTAAGGQVQNRAIYMGDSTPLASTKYLVTFDPAKSATIKGIVVDFCSNDPIIGDTCTAPTGFSITTSPTVDFSATDPGAPTAGGTAVLPGTWTASSDGTTLKLDGGTLGGAVNTGQVYGFAITSVTNPSTLGTFYARIITYLDDTSTDFTGYTAGSEGNIEDYGGFALSTATSISITAKVQETLSFCVSADQSAAGDGDPNAAAGGNYCGDATGFWSSHLPNLTLGHGTSSVKTIDNSQIDTARAYMQVSTNASTGAVIRMHALNGCTNAGLSTNNAADGCPVSGMDNTAAAAMVDPLPNTGGGLFGLYVGSGYTTAGIASSTGTIAPAAPYYHNGNVTEPATFGGAITAGSENDLWFGMDNTANTGVTSPYGGEIADTGGAPCNTVNAHLVFGAVAGLTTPAGIYTGSESLIATGQF